jgi:16S rRNA (guanine527-N7)-methyltransferase
LEILAEYCLPLVKIGGFFLAMKGPKLDEEIIAAKKAVDVLGGEIEKIINLKLPVTGDERNLVVIKKIKQTPEKYPRRPGVPLKKPI